MFEKTAVPFLTFFEIPFSFSTLRIVEGKMQAKVFTDWHPIAAHNCTVPFYLAVLRFSRIAN